MGIKGFQLLNYSMFESSVKILRRVTDLSRFCKVNNIINYSSDESVKDCEKIDSNEETNFSDKLIKWAVQNYISHISFSKLLKLLSEHGIKDLPKNSRDLLIAREERVNVFVVPPGTYTHFGLESNLRNLISHLVKQNLLKEADIGVSVFIDHLPLSQYTRQGLWVILGSLTGFKQIVFLVGAYLGFSRPTSSNLFLTKFVEESKHLCTNGLKINDIVYKLNIERVICDAPAKHFVLNIKGYTGYSSCTKCNAAGRSVNNKVCFMEKSTPRTDKDFENNEIYQSDKTKLLEIPGFGVVSNVTLDYMHLVCLGVVQKLITIWGTHEYPWICMDSASELIKILPKIYPCEFEKKPKSLKIFSRWDANAFRQFLLYYGPVILKGNLEKQYYDHFLLLHVACRLLCSNATEENINLGRNLLNRFVEDYKKLYNEYITHNFHGLYHLADECTTHGTLDSFSAFPFEKFLLKLRNKMKKSKKRSILQTVLMESYDKVFTESITKLKGNDFKVGKKIKTSDGDKFKDYSHHEKLILKNFQIIPSTEGGKYVLLKNKKLIEVMSVLQNKEKSNKTHFIAGKEFSSISNFHSKPFEGLQLGMFEVGEVSDVVDIWSVDMIDKKCMKVPGREGTVMVCLLDENF